MEDCYSDTDNDSPMDYSEFTPQYLQPLSCAELSASIVYRDPPQMNKHSCTEGVNGSVAMCISSLDTCDYDPGNSASLIFELTITPDPDTAIHVTGLSFYERAPQMFSWLFGPTGPNNFPTLYGIRVLKNGVEIFRRDSVLTNNDWNLE